MAEMLYLIRHGELPESFRGRYVGTTDAPLDRAVLPQLAASLADAPCRTVVSSPLRRAVATAQLLGRHLEIDSRLGEIDFGDWENLTYREIELRADRAQLALWAAEPEKMIFPGGEAVAAFFQRVDAVFAALTSRPEPAVAVVTHGGVLMRMLALLAGLPPARQFEVLPPRGSVTRISCRAGRWSVK